MPMTSNLKNHKIIAVVPAFNEGNTIAKVVTSLLTKTDAVIVVDDCSTDDTKHIAFQAGAIVESHSQNKGYDGAINTGFARAVAEGAEIIFTFDADGQHDILDVERLISPIISGVADVVIGTRAERSSFGEFVFSLYTALRFGIKDPLCGLKAYKSEVYTRIGQFDTLQSIGTQLFLESMILGYRVVCIPIKIRDRVDVSRFYARRIKGNIKIIKALLRVIKRTEIMRLKKYEKR